MERQHELVGGTSAFIILLSVWLFEFKRTERTPMNKSPAKDQDVWNNGFDYFFERKEEQTIPHDIEAPLLYHWTMGFISASNYCEHLLKEAKRGTNFPSDI